MSNKFYSDQQMHYAAQASYLNLSNDDISEYSKNHSGNYPSLKELLIEKAESGENLYDLYYNHSGMDDVKNNSFNKDSYEELKDAIDNGKPYDINDYAKTYEEKYMLSILFDKDFNGDSTKPFEPASWCLTEVDNQNDTNGMYGIVLATNGNEALKQGQGNALVSYRGSEHHTQEGVNQVIKDWILADGSLVFPYESKQHLAAADLYERTLNSDMYTTVGSAGHSLGGNLAFIAPILCANNPNMDEKYVQAEGYDAPGVTNNFIDCHQSEINKLSDKMYQHEYTIVGNIFHQVADNVDEAQLNDAGNIGNALNNAAGKDIIHGDFGSPSTHSLCNVEFDKYGNVVTVAPEMSSNIMGKAMASLSAYVDSNNITEEFVQDSLMAPLQGIGQCMINCQDAIQRNDLNRVENEIVKCENSIFKAALGIAPNYYAGKVENIIGSQLPGEIVGAGVNVIGNAQAEKFGDALHMTLEAEKRILNTVNMTQNAINQLKNGVSNYSQQMINSIQQSQNQHNTVGSIQQQNMNNQSNNGHSLGGVYQQNNSGMQGLTKTDLKPNTVENGHSRFSDKESFENRVNSIIEGHSNHIDNNAFEAVMMNFHKDMQEICPNQKEFSDITKCAAYQALNKDYIKDNLGKMAEAGNIKGFNPENYVRDVAEDFYKGRNKDQGMADSRADMKFSGLNMSKNIEQSFNNIFEKTGKCYTLEQVASMSKCLIPELIDKDIQSIGTDCREQQRQSCPEES